MLLFPRAFLPFLKETQWTKFWHPQIWKIHAIFEMRVGWRSIMKVLRVGWWEVNHMIHAIETWHSHGLLCHIGAGLICYALQGRSMIVRIRPWAQTAGSMKCTWPSWNTWERSGPHRMGAWIWINEELHLTVSDIVLTKGSFFREGADTKNQRG